MDAGRTNDLQCVCGRGLVMAKAGLVESQGKCRDVVGSEISNILHLLDAMCFCVCTSHSKRRMSKSLVCLQLGSDRDA